MCCFQLLKTQSNSDPTLLTSCSDTGNASMSCAGQENTEVRLLILIRQQKPRAGRGEPQRPCRQIFLSVCL